MTKHLLSLFGVLALCGSSTNLYSQQSAYTQTNLVGNLPGVANNTDPQLSNPWGIAFVPGAPFWISDNNSGFSTLYDAKGNKTQPTVTIPVASTNPCNPGCPTGIVANTTGTFGGGSFLFDTEDGIVASWTNGSNAVEAVDNSASGAVYKGLALLNNGTANFLLAANFRSGKIEVLDSNLKPAALSGTFTDPNLPVGFAPHGVHVINSSVYVTYALQDSPKHDPINGTGNGTVDVFDMNGNFVKTLVTGGALNSPWGVAMAPKTFGGFAGDILVGNFGDGVINVYDPNTGKALGQIADSNNHALMNPGLWDMVFGNGGTGDPNTLYITAGGSDQTQGLFAAITPNQSVSGADFSLSLSTQTLTLSPGSTGSLTISAAGMAGFSGAVALTCAAPAGITCSFSPNSITPGTSTAASTLQVVAATTVLPAPYNPAVVTMTVLPFSLSFFGLIFALRKRRISELVKRLSMIGLVVVGAVLVFSAGCGSGSHASSAPTPAGNTAPNTVTVTGTSGTLGVSHGEDSCRRRRPCHSACAETAVRSGGIHG